MDNFKQRIKEMRKVEMFIRCNYLSRECGENIICAHWYKATPYEGMYVHDYIRMQIQEVEGYSNLMKQVSNYFLEKYGLKHRYTYLPNSRIH